jgi:beta-lactamase regulating signal transducer with metallopeptidase domain
VMVLIVQWLLRGRLSARWRYNLWLLVLLRLIVPVTPQSSLSIFNLSNRFLASVSPTATTKVEIVSRPLAVPHFSNRQTVVEAVPLAKSTKPHVMTTVIPRGRATIIPWRLLLASAWITGTLILLARIAYATIRLSRAVRRMSQVDTPDLLNAVDRCCDELNIRRRRVIVLSSDDLPAPALMGVMRPRLLLPRRVLDQFAPAELRLILLHELGHLKRNDVLVNWLVSLLNALHWFNPMLWVAFARLRADRELATDELVLARTGDAEQSAYGDTIIKLLQFLGRPRGRQSAVPMVGAVGILERAHLLRRRITMIAQFRTRHTKRWTLVAAVCMLALAGFGLTDAVRGDNAEPAASSARPTTRPSTTAPVNDEVRAAIDETARKLLAKSTSPTPDDLDAAMKELALKLRARGLIVNAQGKPLNEDQVYDEVRHAQGLVAAKIAKKPSMPADTAATLRKLAQNAPEINFTGSPFGDTIDFLRDVTDLNFFVNWRALEAAGLDRNAPVTVRLKNVPFDQALRYILRDAGGGNIALDFAVVDGIVNISTADDLASDTKVRVYSVAGLLKQMPTTLPSSANEEVARTNKADQLMQLIRETVAPDSWRDAGGTVGAIREINGRLVITQTEANHALITKLLEEIGGDDANGLSAAGAGDAEPVAAHK